MLIWLDRTCGMMMRIEINKRPKRRNGSRNFKNSGSMSEYIVEPQGHLLYGEN
jgi:hypothetical protein